MRLGIDFGTTRTVVAACDRGNYPVISFDTPKAEPQEFFPSVIAEKSGELRFGFEALDRRGDPSWALCPSFKRWLSSPEATPGRKVQVGSVELPLIDVITRYLEAQSSSRLDHASDVMKTGAACRVTSYDFSRLSVTSSYRFGCGVTRK